MMEKIFVEFAIQKTCIIIETDIITIKSMEEIIFLEDESPEGRFTVKQLGISIYTQTQDYQSKSYR